MALTYNRPDYTATELNTTWTTLRNGLSASMPSAIETVAGQSNFSVIDIYDTGTAASTGLSIVDKIISDHEGSIKFLNHKNGAKIQIIIPYKNNAS